MEHYLPSGPLRSAGYFACQKISAIVAPIPGMNRAHEVRPIPKRTQTPVMVADTHTLAVAGRAQRGEAQGDNPRHRRHRSGRRFARPGPRIGECAVSIIDRKKDVIIARCYNIYPIEVEDLRFRDPDAAALLAFCRENLAAYKVPRRLFTVGEMPHGPTGKILKRTLRDWLAEGRLTEVTP